MDRNSYPGGIWFVDFEFHPQDLREGNLPRVVCMVAREFHTAQIIRLWHTDFAQHPCAPFPTDSTALFVAYYASAEIGCFNVLGWPPPTNVIDLFMVFRNKLNGLPPPAGMQRQGFGLLDALDHYRVPHMSALHKDDMRELCLGGGPWNDQQQRDLLAYCEADVCALAALWPRMQADVDAPRELLRGQYAIALADIECRGVPIDMPTLECLRSRWEDIKAQLIARLDRRYGVYVDGSFSKQRFARYLRRAGLKWPRTGDGNLKLDDDTFRDMARAQPVLQPLHQLRQALSKLRLNTLQVGDDGRNRCMLSMFSAKTGRNQPSTAKFIFGPSAWMRGLIKPPPGKALAYIDWNQQEFGIAAALSNDLAMQQAYASGDPYLTFAKQAGAVPANATKQSHRQERDRFKQCVLAVQYGMHASTLAERIGTHELEAEELLKLHRRTYAQFWSWVETVKAKALFHGRLHTRYGWTLHVGPDRNIRSLVNFPMQATGAEMLRLTCVQLYRDRIGVCAPVHDALLIEADLEDIDAAVAHTQSVMADISRQVLQGFTLTSDAKIIRYPDRYADDRGQVVWNEMMDLVGLPGNKV